MPKSIIEIDVQDAAFKAFLAAFGKYQDAVKKLPEGWQKTGKLTQEQEKQLKLSTVELQKTKAVLGEINTAHGVIVQREREQLRLERESAKATKERLVTFKNIAASVANTTFQLAKWAAFGGIAGIATGVFGGGLLAGAGSNLRRTSQGLGVSPGDLRAAEINYSKYLDVRGTLGNITNAQTDLGKQWILAGLGVSDQDQKNKSAAELLPGLLPQLVNRYKQLGSTVQGAQAAGLDQIVDLGTLRRLSSLSPKELQDTAASYGKDRASLAIQDQTLQRWQQLDVQLERTKDRLENTFLTALERAAPALEKLSEGIEKSIETFAKSPKVGELIEKLSVALENGAKYLTSDEFQSDVKVFAADVGKLAHVIHRTVGLIPGLGNNDDYERGLEAASAGNRQAPNKFGMSTWGEGMGAVGGTTRRLGVHAHNPGNIRSGANAFASYGSDDEGIRAIAHQLQLYYSGKSRAAGFRHLDTVQDIISTYAPSSDHNNTAAYIQNVSKALGVKGTDHIDLNDTGTLSKLIAAITRQEGTGYKGSAGQIAVIIQNDTGGNATVIANQLAH